MYLALKPFFIETDGPRHHRQGFDEIDRHFVFPLLGR
jgi:hypothetical protein